MILTTPTRPRRPVKAPKGPIKVRLSRPLLKARKLPKWVLRKSTGTRRSEDEGKEYAALLDPSGEVLKGPEGLSIWIKKEVPLSLWGRVRRMIVNDSLQWDDSHLRSASRQLFPLEHSNWVSYWSTRKKRPFILNRETNLTYWL